jgi:hypothetical protein
MDPVLPATCLGVCALATVILTGNYLLSALVILPVLQRQATEQDQARHMGGARDANRTFWLASSRRMTGAAAGGGVAIILTTAVMQAA